MSYPKDSISTLFPTLLEFHGSQTVLELNLLEKKIRNFTFRDTKVLHNEDLFLLSPFTYDPL